jgi:hypothetical protein
MFNTWISSHHSLLVSSFADFLNFCSFFFLDKGVLLYISCVLRLRTTVLLSDIELLKKKNLISVGINVEA